jgi:histidyl-tRNA synthetase
MQCDFDTIGTTSVASDIETALVIHDLMSAIGFEEFTIRINNRMVLTGLLERLELADKSVPLLRALDKLAKIGREQVAEEMQSAAGATKQQADEVLKLAELSGENETILSRLEPLVAGSERGQAGVARLAEVLAAVRAAGVPAGRIELDVAIARGLDYYTGIIYETFLGALPGIGSVCSGGRYDNLAELYTRQELPGIGASLGLDRLLAAMEELGMLGKSATPAEVFIPYFEADRLHEYLQLAARLRGAGLRVELYPEPKKLGQQLKYADRRGFPIALIAGQRELEAGTCQLKHLASGKSEEVSLEDHAAAVIAAIRGMLLVSSQ